METILDNYKPEERIALASKYLDAMRESVNQMQLKINQAPEGLVNFLAGGHSRTQIESSLLVRSLTTESTLPLVFQLFLSAFRERRSTDSLVKVGVRPTENKLYVWVSILPNDYFATLDDLYLAEEKVNNLVYPSGLSVDVLTARSEATPLPKSFIEVPLVKAEDHAITPA